MKNLKKLFLACTIPFIALAVSSCSDTSEKTEIRDEQEVLISESGKVLNVNPAESKVEWLAKKVTGQHNGTVNVSGGKLTVEDSQIKSGNFEIDMNTITVLDIENPESNAKLTGHLRSDDFFSAESHPKSVFEITGIEERSDESGNTHVVNGNLTIKGITNNITFPAKISASEDKVNAVAEFNVDRTKWDVKYRSGKFFEDLGDNLIYDDFTIKFDIVAQ